MNQQGMVKESRAPPPESLSLYSAKEGFYFEPNYAYPVSNKPTLQIHRPDGAILINEPTIFNLPSRPSYNVYGILGMIELLSGPHIIVVTERELACKFLGHYIWKVKGSKILSCNNDAMNHLSEQEYSDEGRYIRLLESFLNSDWLYYSSTFDLTRNVQSQTSPKSQDGLLRVDLRFLVNRFIASPFLKVLERRTDTRLEDFLIFCIEGFVELKTLNVNQERVTFGIFSRRATGRVGTRYHSRGIDDNGNVSNFVETEQILLVNNQLASFVQIRGSIPLFWRQNINIKYKPPFEFYNHSNASQVFEKHFDGLVKNYGQVTAVNLINQRGWEGELAKAFSKQVREYPKKEMHYIAFDFNAQCPRMKWQRVSNLLDSIEDDLGGQGYFIGKLDSAQGDLSLTLSKVEKNQSGVIRTNCIDCLDRTNLVQSFIGRRILIGQLQQMGVILKPDKKQTATTTIIDGADFPELNFIFKQIWADNGDAISKQYSGTGALKADFTRTGKRTHMGLLSDGLNSIMRYFLNNFTDGARQDSMDLFYGHYTIRLENYYSPFIYEFDQRLLIAPIILGCSLLLFFYFSISSQLSIGYKLLWLFMLTITMIFSVIIILQDGVRYVQYPKLRPPPVATLVRPWTRTLAEHRRQLFTFTDPSRKVHVI